MFNRPRRAILSATLLRPPRRAAAGLQAGVDRGSSVVPLFCAKPAASAEHRPRVGWPRHAAALSARAETRKLSLRITPERRWRMKLAAAFLRQSCQALVVDAIDRHIERLMHDPANRMLVTLVDRAAAVRE